MTVRQVAGDFERIVRFERGYDCRERCDHEKKGDHGIAGVKLWFLLRGPAGAVQFSHMTNWYPVTAPMPPWMKPAGHPGDYRGMPADLGYHSYEPRYEGQDRMDSCEWLFPDENQGCYYDGSALQAEPVFERLVERGDEGVWTALLAYYQEVFDEGMQGGFGQALDGLVRALTDTE